MNKTGKTKSKTKLCEVDDEQKRQGKKILQVLFYLNQ